MLMVAEKWSRTITKIAILMRKFGIKIGFRATEQSSSQLNLKHKIEKYSPSVKQGQRYDQQTFMSAVRFFFKFLRLNILLSL